MSIRPQFVEAILAGRKGVEFRKRGLAPDVSVVLIYATMPVGRVLGAFEVGGYDLGSPSALWHRHRHHAGIARAAYRDYYRGTKTAVGILIRDARALERPFSLSELDSRMVAPQSFAYLSLDAARPMLSPTEAMLPDGNRHLSDTGLGGTNWPEAPNSQCDRVEVTPL